MYSQYSESEAYCIRRRDNGSEQSQDKYNKKLLIFGNLKYDLPRKESQLAQIKSQVNRYFHDGDEQSSMAHTKYRNNW